MMVHEIQYGADIPFFFIVMLIECAHLASLCEHFFHPIIRNSIAHSKAQYPVIIKTEGPRYGGGGGGGPWEIDLQVKKS